MADWVTDETRDKQYSDIAGLKKWIIRDLKKLSIIRPTPVQFACIPPALSGKNVIGGAKTGSGKTLAFVLPVLNKLSDDPYGIYCLVMTPTRELAYQIADQFRAVGASMGVRVSVCVGGLDRLFTVRDVESEPHILVATPGRLSDILKYGRNDAFDNDVPRFTLKKIKFLIIDEADRLLGGKFSDQLSTIMPCLPEKRQTLMFSATITDEIQTIEHFAQGEVFKWETTQAGAGESTVVQLKEYYCLVNPRVRDAALVAYLLQWRELQPQQQAIVFVDTCATAEALGLTVHALGLPCVSYHSNKTQTQRLEAINSLKSNKTKLMFATSLADRGLDIPLVGLVVNHRLPNDYRTYIHRVGRTARAGRAGTAMSIITPEDQNLLTAIEARNPSKLIEYEVDQKLVRRIMKDVLVTKREQEIKLEDSGFHDRKIINRRKELILQGLDPEEECRKMQERIRIGQLKRRQKFVKNNQNDRNNSAECSSQTTGASSSKDASHGAASKLHRIIAQDAKKLQKVKGKVGKKMNSKSCNVNTKILRVVKRNQSQRKS